jgi:Mg/Co/Ni transporter MgtE
MFALLYCVSSLQEKAALLAALDPAKVADILALMPPAEAVTLLAAMSDTSMTVVMGALSSEERDRMIKVSNAWSDRRCRVVGSGEYFSAADVLVG